jgi:trehalose-6-phosphate synthase
MQIVSYRGPSQPGGVASLLERAHKRYPYSAWWHVNDSTIQTIASYKRSAVAAIPNDIKEGHYRYCNEFLWPLMHGMPEKVRYAPADHNCYRALSISFAAHMNWDNSSEPLFANDYQFALLPAYLTGRKAARTVFFWHIPWAESFPSEFTHHIAEIARGLLNCRVLGFHTVGYVESFCKFVEHNLPEYRRENGSIISRNGHVTKVIASAAGIDYAAWSGHGQRITPVGEIEIPYILSVDRADYTKGVSERIEAIHKYFRAQPEMCGKIQFVFVCQRTRPGIAAYDDYWASCRTLFHRTQSEFSTSDWTPIKWVTTPVTPRELAEYYANASAMLVNPARDGLNLTAKEFIATNMRGSSTLILSSGAGVWHELKNHVVTIRACNGDAIATAIKEALDQPIAVRRTNLHRLKQIVRESSFERWWQQLTGLPAEETIAGQVPA